MAEDTGEINPRHGYQRISLKKFMIVVHVDRSAELIAKELGISVDFVLQLRAAFPNCFRCSSLELLTTMDCTDAFVRVRKSRSQGVRIAALR